MPRITSTIKEQEDTRTLKPSVHPIWNGIGFALIVLTPVIAYFGAIYLLDLNSKNSWVPIPSTLILNEFSQPMILVVAILTIALIVLIAAIFTAITFLLYGLFVPSLNSPMDVPYIKYRGRRYKR